jgi:transposase
MGLDANRRRYGLLLRLERGVVALGTHGVSTGSCREARPNSPIRKKDNDMHMFIGLDVSLASTAACVLDERGKVMKESKVDSEPEALTVFLRGLSGSMMTIGLEAGPLSQWLHRHLTEDGFEVVLMETRQVKGALQAMPIKTDRRDAEGIARLLQMGWFRPVHCKSISAQEMRAVLTARKAVQKAALDIELSLRGVLRNFGLKMGKVARGRFEARVRELVASNTMLEAAAEPMLRARAELRGELARLEKLLRDLAKVDPICRLMMTMPGVGAVVALTVRAAIDDPERFRSSKDVGPWAGLTPSRHQSGERDVVGAITRAGDAGLRTALFQAATVMLNRGPKTWLTAWALRVAQRRGKKRATVALARRIGVVLHRMWRDNTEFRFTRDADGSATAA